MAFRSRRASCFEATGTPRPSGCSRPGTMRSIVRAVCELDYPYGVRYSLRRPVVM